MLVSGNFYGNNKMNRLKILIKHLDPKITYLKGIVKSILGITSAKYNISITLVCTILFKCKSHVERFTFIISSIKLYFTPCHWQTLVFCLRLLQMS